MGASGQAARCPAGHPWSTTPPTPALCGRTRPFDQVEIAYGVDAGIFCVNAANVPLSRYQEQKYGYEATLWMLDQTSEALERPVSNYDWIYRHNLLI